MVETMTRRMDSAQGIISYRESGAISNFLIRLRHTFPTKGAYRDSETLAESSCASDVIGMAMGDEYATDTTSLLALSHDSIKIGSIVNGWINEDSAIDSTSHYNGIC